MQDCEPARPRRRPGRCQRVWLHLAEHLGNLRDPAALPGWLATTTRRECGRLLRAAHRPQATALAPDAYNIRDDQAQNAEQELLAAERHAALREAFTSLPPRYQQLITLLIHDPPHPGDLVGVVRRGGAGVRLVSAQLTASRPGRIQAIPKGQEPTWRPGPAS